jgi:hypothetical protein
MTLISFIATALLLKLNQRFSERFDPTEPGTRAKAGLLFLACLVSGMWFGKCLADDLSSMYRHATGR